MTRLKTLFLTAALVGVATAGARAEPKVVASIKPVHSLVSAVMEGVGTPGLIVEGANSPHTYALKPSQAKLLEEADIVFWIGEDLETFLEKPVETVASKATSVELMDAHGVTKLGFRSGGAFEKHSHGHDDDDHDHGEKAGHDDHDHDHDHGEKAGHDHDDHKHESAEAHGDHDHDRDDHDHTAAKADHDDHDHEGHAHGAFDSHLWLDPQNAKAFVHEIAETLVKADPANAATYEANAEAVEARLDALTAEVAATLKPVQGRGFVVFHDAYQYFEKRFGLAAVGSITVSPEVMPGAARLGEIKEKVKESGAICVFAEPQFEPKLISVVTEGTNAKGGVIDPLGATLDDGPDLYFTLIRNMAGSIRDCLAEAS